MTIPHGCLLLSLSAAGSPTEASHLTLETTMTVDRTPYCHKIRYGITGAPILDGDDMDGSHAPGVGLAPTLIELVYSAARDGKPATVSASVTGQWTRFGKREPFDDQMTTHFKNGPVGWPAWLAAEARLHDPAVLPPPADRSATLLWAADQIDAETRRLKADEVLEPDKFRPCRDASAQLRRLAAEAKPLDGRKTGTAFSPGEGVYGLDPYYGGVEAQQPDTETREATLSGRVAQLVADDARALRMDLYDDLATYARQTGNTGLQQAQIRDHLTEFLLEGLLRRAVAGDRLRCPRCRTDITDYAEDDHVFRTGDDRPYCSSDCVIAAHRKGLPTAPAVPVQPAAVPWPHTMLGAAEAEEKLNLNITPLPAEALAVDETVEEPAADGTSKEAGA